MRDSLTMWILVEIKSKINIKQSKYSEVTCGDLHTTVAGKLTY